MKLNSIFLWRSIVYSLCAITLSSCVQSARAGTSYPSCVTSDPTRICIGLKVVSYENSGVPILSEEGAIRLVDQMNEIWGQCNIGFQIEVYQKLDPTTVGLPVSPDWNKDTNAIREQFGERNRFLIAAVGSQSGSTIAVTMMPNSGIYGTIVDSAYAHNPLTVGHELGHYQGLYHGGDSNNLMNPYIGNDTKTITPNQCEVARGKDNSDWLAMERSAFSNPVAINNRHNFVTRR